MPRLLDRIKDTSTTTGTSAVTLSNSAPSGYRTFGSAYTVGDVFPYCISDSTSGLWETGLGYLATSTTLVRDTVDNGSSGPGVLTNFTAGTKDVFVTATAHFLEDVDSGAILHKINGMAMP